MDDALLMRVLHRFANLDEQLESLSRIEPVLIAEVGHAGSADQFHHHEGPSAWRGAGVEHPGDTGMIHQGQRLSFDVEPGDQGPGIHAELEDFERHIAAHRLHLFGSKHHAPAAFAEAFHEAVASQGFADVSFGRGAEGSGFGGGLLEELLIVRERAQQGFQAAAELRILRADLFEKGRPLGTGKFQGTGEQFFFAIGR